VNQLVGPYTHLSHVGAWLNGDGVDCVDVIALKSTKATQPGRPSVDRSMSTGSGHAYRQERNDVSVDAAGL